MAASEPITTGRGDRRVTLPNGYLVRRYRTSHGSEYSYRQYRGKTPARLREIMTAQGEAANIVAEVHEQATRLAQSAQAAQERNG